MSLYNIALWAILYGSTMLIVRVFYSDRGQLARTRRGSNQGVSVLTAERVLLEKNSFEVFAVCVWGPRPTGRPAIANAADGLVAGDFFKEPLDGALN